MNIFYIPLGSFCYPKIIIRETKREYNESLPFDFNSSPHLSGVTNILKELYTNNKYEIELKEILQIYNGNELCVSEKNMYIVHFFKDYDLKENVTVFPCSANMIKDDITSQVKNKFNKRFSRLLHLLNDTKNILCFLRIENYDNPGWKYELKEFTHILSLFKNPNKFLIYSQNLIDPELHFDNSRKLDYNYDIPVLFIKHYFYDIEMINNKNLFITILSTFEYLMNNDKIINIENNNIIEKYYIEDNKNILYKLSNINCKFNFYINNNFLYIDHHTNGYIRYLKNIHNNIYSIY